MKKILILANDTTYTYNLRDEVIEALVGQGYEVVIASQLLLFQEELKALGARLVDIQTNRHGKNPVSDIGLLNQYIRLLRKEKPDIVLTYNIKPNVYGGMACRITKTPYMPNITGLGTAVEYPGAMQRLTIRLYKNGIAGASCIFFQNEENRQFFIDHKMIKYECRTVLLPGSGVNLKRHKPLEYPKDETIRFLFVARIMKEKGIDIFLSAARRIIPKHQNVEYHICGYCDDEKYLDILKKVDKRIIYHGEQKDMMPLFETSHCIVHPSYYPEGMSNVLLEAAAHCRPIITTNRAGCRETVDNGNTGFLIPVNNETALVDAMEHFLNLRWEEKRSMGWASRMKVERLFNRQIVVQKYLQEINHIWNMNSDEFLNKSN